jgi:hypothetical protein
MKTTHEQDLLAAALVCALGATTAYSQTQSSYYRPLTLAPDDANSSGGGGTGAGVEDQEAELAKKLQNPVAFQLGYRYYADKPSGGQDWGLRFNVTFLFPK